MNATLQAICAILIGFLLDLIIGDPRWMPSPVVWIGRLIAGLESPLRKLFPSSSRGQSAAGIALVVIVGALTYGISWAVLLLAGLVAPWLRFILTTFMCYQTLATRDLEVESMRVYRALEDGDLEGARKAVSMIVGRDTASLDASGVTRAAVESVAENTCDGVVAPLLCLVIGGPQLGMLYKAISTMDSMVGYRNERYAHFGTAAARTDDVAAFIPARLTALLMIATSRLGGLDARGAWRVWRRDRLKTSSPNSGQAESACAGALGVQLGGDASYFGHPVSKKTLGDADRAIEAYDIVRANRLLYLTAASALILFCALRIVVVLPFLWMEV